MDNLEKLFDKIIVKLEEQLDKVLEHPLRGLIMIWIIAKIIKSIRKK
jgi:hypothetical protein